MARANDQSSFRKLLYLLGDPIDNSEEETFVLFSQPFPSQNLGFIDPKAANIDVEIGSKTFSVTQSPSLLRSNREGGTTGAVLWKITPSLASWLACPSNPFRQCDLLGSATTIVELGCGISGLIGLLLAPELGKYVLTDQAYVSKILQENLQADRSVTASSQKSRPKTLIASHENLTFHTLDWENDAARGLSRAFEPKHPQIDILIACDCVYNDYLIQPFVDTCVDVCSLASTNEENHGLPTILLIAQQLRSEETFQAWLDTSLKRFDIWRIPDHLLTEDLRDGSGFVVHLGLLKDQIRET